ncbi:hypothetical protein C8F01DRAFT_985967 [Mycena amicta]|nr:hypothetical protein C8F01DRAFT_985967 [Mycena amicta]
MLATLDSEPVFANHSQYTLPFLPRSSSPGWSDASSLASSRRSSLASTCSSSSGSASPYSTPYPLPFTAPFAPTPSESASPSSSSTATKRKRNSRTTSPKSCSHCAATTTPLWRRHPETHLPLCNACGLYLTQRGSLRPNVLIEADASPSDDAPSSNDHDGDPALTCSHCGTHRTSVWRRSATGERVCNACGVYARLRGRERPLKLRMRKGKVRPRCKHPKVQ